MITAAGQGRSRLLGKSGDRPEASLPARTELPVCLPGKTLKNQAEQDAGLRLLGLIWGGFQTGIGERLPMLVL